MIFWICGGRKKKYMITTGIILFDFTNYLIYYTHKKVTYELLTHEYNYWR